METPKRFIHIKNNFYEWEFETYIGWRNLCYTWAHKCLRAGLGPLYLLFKLAQWCIQILVGFWVVQRGTWSAQ